LNDYSFTSAPQLKRDPLGGTLIAMNCPRCSTELDARSSAGITAAICARCAGAWLRGEDLERAIRLVAAEQGIVLKTLALLEGPARPTTLACPECATALETLTMRGVEVERCVACRGVFLDAGEGRTLAQRAVRAATDWDRSYQALLRTIREWATPAAEPCLFGPGDFTSSGHGSVE